MIQSYLALSAARITTPSLKLEAGLSSYNNSVMTGIFEQQSHFPRLESSHLEAQAHEGHAEGEEEEKVKKEEAVGLVEEVRRMLPGETLEEVEKTVRDPAVEAVMEQMLEWQGLDTNVLASAVGALASQEVTKVVTGRGEPFRGLMVYCMEGAETAEVGAGEW